MDICRGVLRAIFLDYPLSKAIDMVFSICGSAKEFLAPIEHLIRWRMPEFSLTDTRSISDGLKQRLDKKHSPFFVELLKYLGDNQYDNIFTDINSDNPKIKRDQLFRWMELTKYVDGDLLLIARIAFEDKGDRNVKSLLWGFMPDIDKKDSLLEENAQYADLHIHYNVANDRFLFRWLNLMNQFTLRPNKIGETKQNGDILLDEWTVKVRQYNPIMLWKEKFSNKSYMDWIGFASVIRFFLFRFIVEGKTVQKEDRENLKKSLTDSDFAKLLCEDCSRKVEYYRDSAYKDFTDKTYLNKVLDYCVQKNLIDDETKNSPHCLVIGERWLLYNILHRIANDSTNAKQMASWFYLYTLIKNRCRVEYFLSNDLKGLANYNLCVGNSNGGIDKEFAFLYMKLLRMSFKNKEFAEFRLSAKDCDTFLKDKDRPICMKAVLLISKSMKIEEAKNILSKNINYLRGEKIVGVDFAGSDTKKRPVEYSKIIRYLREKGINNLTYHVGEDFYDLVDGLRAIEEIVFDLNWRKPNRLAHLLALFTNPQKYYEAKHYTVAMPHDILEENIKWIYSHVPEGMDKDLFKLDSDKNGKDIEFFKHDKNIIKVVAYNQKRILKEIIDREIPIETCPTSNLRIGFFDKYSELPTCKLIKEENAVVTINTDAAGLLGTTLQNEYNLIALALEKDLEKNKDEIQSVLNRLRTNAIKSLFS